MLGHFHCRYCNWGILWLLPSLLSSGSYFSPLFNVPRRRAKPRGHQQQASPRCRVAAARLSGPQAAGPGGRAPEWRGAGSGEEHPAAQTVQTGERVPAEQNPQSVLGPGRDQRAGSDGPQHGFTPFCSNSIERLQLRVKGWVVRTMHCRKVTTATCDLGSFASLQTHSVWAEWAACGLQLSGAVLPNCTSTGHKRKTSLTILD